MIRAILMLASILLLVITAICCLKTAQAFSDMDKKAEMSTVFKNSLKNLLAWDTLLLVCFILDLWYKTISL